MDRKKRIVRLECEVQNYAWGRIGKQSAVGRLYALQSKQPLDDDKPYAELWMGTHDSGPSFVVIHEDSDVDVILQEDNYLVTKNNSNHHYASNGLANGLKTKSVLLKDWILNNPSFLGDKVVKRWGANLPFLFKVLSVNKALSIQAHPDKKLAEKLHELQPKLYKDANHKPEMAFAITKFEALCGFVSLEELQHMIGTVPEIQCVLGQSLSDALMQLSVSNSTPELMKSTLKSAFTTIMTASKDIIADALIRLNFRLLKATQERELTKKEILIMRLAEQYPGDVGILSAFFLNYIQLEPGEALYLDANEPHAYLSGECLECMATSDNVVRAGLTPKYIDTETLCTMLTYKQNMPEILSGFPVNKYTKRYIPPFDEFEMDSCLLPRGHSVEFPSIAGPSILIVLEGKGELVEDGQFRNTLHCGDILFVPADTNFQLAANSDLHCYRAGVNSKVL